MSYTGQMSNSITTKEDHLLHANLIKEWQNGMQHNIPIQGSFTLFNYLNLTPSFNFTDRMYTRKVNRSWDDDTQTEYETPLTAFTTYTTGACRLRQAPRYTASGRLAARFSVTR